MSCACRALFLVLTLCTAQAAAAPPPAPLLRIESGRHTAFIHALAVDEASGRVYSASEDKTVREWRIADGRLLDVFRVPAGPRAEGQLYALALTPDGRTLATAGWTCWDIEGRACIYLFDTTTGELIGRISGLPEVVSTLKFSPDGEFLAAGLMGAQGLRVIRMRDHAIVATDAAYRDKLLELDFSAQGLLAASGLDGFVRLYNRQFQLLGRVNADFAGHQPFGLRYAPNGQWLAVGFNDAPRISVLRAADLGAVRTLALDAQAGLKSLTRLAWSPDSNMIYAAGESMHPGASSIYRWHLGDPAHAERLPAAQGRVGDIELTRHNELLFAAEDPVLGLIDQGGRTRYLLGSGVPDFERTSTSLQVSDDGSIVEIALSPARDAIRRFSVSAGRLQSVDGTSKDLRPALLRAAGWQISRWNESDGPLINGHRPALEPYETAHAFALAPHAALALLGSEWALRAIARDGTARWSVHTPSVVRAVNVSPDERLVIAALADGTLDWFRLADGALVLSLYLHADGSTWIAWTPDGSYASSPYGDSFVGWQINRGLDQAPDFFRAVQFERELYRPDLIAASLRIADRASSPRAEPSAAIRLLGIAPPRLLIRPDSATAELEPGHRRIRVEGRSLGLPMTDIALYVNEIPVTQAAARKLTAAESKSFVREFDVDLTDPDSDIRVEVFNGHSLGIADRVMTGVTHAANQQAKGDLYVIAIGANQFPHLDPGLYLSYAARDAEDFAKAMQTVGANRFRQVHLLSLSDLGNPPLKASVLAALQSLRATRGIDTVVVFLASHGVSDAAGNYFFVPRDAAQADIDAILDKKPLGAGSSLVEWTAFFDALRNTAGRRLLIVDTCQARDITGHFQDYSLVKRSASSHLAFILASKGNEESQEYAPGGHGLFTYALLEGLRAGSDTNRDGRITVAEWFRFAADLVERLRDRSIGTQTPQFFAPRELQAMSISIANAPR